MIVLTETMENGSTKKTSSIANSILAKFQAVSKEKDAIKSYTLSENKTSPEMSQKSQVQSK